jgi:diaminopimelate epimerase
MRNMNNVTSKNRTILFNKPITTPFLIPVIHASTPNCISDPFMVDGVCYRVTAMSFGSPHGAVVVDNVDTVDVPTIGSALGTHCLFPKGASIVFIQVLDRETIKARLWQLNEGEIPFTPEAVCVAGTAAIMLQKILTTKATVLMGGNEFQVEWNKGEGTVSLTGPDNLLGAAG